MAQSEVITFRLNPEDPQEARALEILQRFKSMDLDTRFIMTKALIGLEGVKTQSEFLDDTAQELQFTVTELRQAIEELKRGGIVIEDRRPDKPSDKQGGEVDELVAAVKRRKRKPM